MWYHFSSWHQPHLYGSLHRLVSKQEKSPMKKSYMYRTVRRVSPVLSSHTDLINRFASIRELKVLPAAFLLWSMVRSYQINRLYSWKLWLSGFLAVITCDNGTYAQICWHDPISSNIQGAHRHIHYFSWCKIVHFIVSAWTAGPFNRGTYRVKVRLSNCTSILCRNISSQTFFIAGRLENFTGILLSGKISR